MNIVIELESSNEESDTHRGHFPINVDIKDITIPEGFEFNTFVVRDLDSNKILQYNPYSGKSRFVDQNKMKEERCYNFDTLDHAKLVIEGYRSRISVILPYND